MKHTMCWGLCLAFAVASAWADVTETKEYNFELKDEGRISLSNVNGDIRIEGVAGNKVHVVAVKKAGTQEYLDNLKIEIDASDELIRIETRHPRKSGSWFSRSDGSGSVSYTLSVPVSAQLDAIETVNGAIEVHGVHGAVDVETVNGKISLEGLNSNARIETVNGTITARFDVLGSGQTVKADAVNGRVVMNLPKNSSAQIHAETLNGSIDADDFDLKVDKGFVGRDLDGEIGAGEARVHIDTVNGSVSIKSNG